MDHQDLPSLKLRNFRSQPLSVCPSFRSPPACSPLRWLWDFALLFLRLLFLLLAVRSSRFLFLSLLHTSFSFEPIQFTRVLFDSLSFSLRVLHASQRSRKCQSLPVRALLLVRIRVRQPKERVSPGASERKERQKCSALQPRAASHLTRSASHSVTAVEERVRVSESACCVLQCSAVQCSAVQCSAPAR